MKKNININLFGTLYAIDEDACTLLENYLDNMRSYFAKRDGGDEIFDDIEHRVAEHLWSLKENGMTAIDIDTVKQIISSIGNPDEMESEVEEVADSKIEETSDAEADSEDKEQSEGEDQGEGECKDNGQSEGKAQSESNSNASNDTYTNAKAEAIGGKWTDRVLHHVSTHRFYRDGKDKIGGGVISGLCHYCGGGDIVVWRVGIVLYGGICPQSDIALLFHQSFVSFSFLRANNYLYSTVACGSRGTNNRGATKHDGQGGNARVDKQGYNCRG